MTPLPLPKLSAEAYDRIDRTLAPVDSARSARYPGEQGTRQPVHTVYVPAHQYTTGLATAWGQLARDALLQHAGTPESLTQIVRTSPDIGRAVFDRVLAKLAQQPIEDLRIDFEDGYGTHTDEEEDDAAAECSRQVAAEAGNEHSPAFIGLRPKSLESTASRKRALRTLDLFIGGLCETGRLPEGLVLTLPKVTDVEQVAAFAEVCAALERAHALPPGRLVFEIQVETTQAVLGADGSASVARMIHAGAGRVSGLHYGTYDYSAACGIASAYQSLDHPVADHAKAVMQVAAAATGVRLSDGSTNVLPVGDGDEIRAAWRTHARLVRRSLERGFYQGWDLHPAQLVTRYAATYAFFREGFPAAAARLQAYLGQREGSLLDEPATAQAMASLLVRGLHCGALDEAEVVEGTSADLSTLNALYKRRIG